MRSGLYNYTDAPELSAQLDRDPTKVWTTDELLAIAFTRPPNFQPGTAFEYSDPKRAPARLMSDSP
jgi:D-alanyl-D-alanine carboxypeptidase